MYPFIETIQIERGKVHNINYHNKRMNETREVFWKGCPTLDLSDFVKITHEEIPVKCRVVYGETIEDISYSPYVIRPVSSLRLVHADSIEYTYKAVNREELSTLFSHRGAQDEILIIKEGLITDTSIANVALYDGDKWYTPKQPLLKGTQRACLLDNGIIIEKEIKSEELFRYSQITLFNAMIDFGRIKIDITPDNIVYNNY